MVKNFEKMEKMEFSTQERRLLSMLQADATASLAQLAEVSGAAQSTVWRKIQEFERAGIVLKKVAILDPAKVGRKLAVLASIRLRDHDEDTVEGFTSLVLRSTEILECHKISGNADYILKIRTVDVEAYEEFMTHNLLRSPFVREVVSSFVLKEIKSTTALAV